MTALVSQKLFGNLPELAGLGKTPGAYWQEVLQMAHQRAMPAKQQADLALGLLWLQAPVAPPLSPGGLSQTH